MMEEIKKHILHYLALFLILGFGFFGLLSFSHQPDFQRLIVLTMALLYMVWGIVHHLLENNLRFKIVVEYTLVSALAATVLLLLTKVAG